MRRLAIAVLAAFAASSTSASAAWETDYVKLTHTYSDVQQLIALGQVDGWAIDGNGRLLRRDASGWKRSAGIEPLLLRVGVDKSAWAFGNTRSALHAWRSDGTRWIDHADRARDSFVLDAAAIADNDVWVAASQSTRTKVRYRLRHWDGSAWRTVATPLPVDGLAATAPNDVWATVDQSETRTQPAILHWDGASWKRVPTPRIALPKPITTRLGGETMTHRPAAELEDIVALSPTDAWAVGAVITRLCCDERVYGREILLHWDGTSWKRFSLGVTKTQIVDVSADPVGGVWIAANPFGRRGRPYVLNLRDGRAPRLPLPARPRERDVGIKVVAAVPGTPEAWAFVENGLRARVGTQDNENLIYRYR